VSEVSQFQFSDAIPCQNEAVPACHRPTLALLVSQVYYCPNLDSGEANQQFAGEAEVIAPHAMPEAPTRIVAERAAHCRAAARAWTSAAAEPRFRFQCPSSKLACIRCRARESALAATPWRTRRPTLPRFHRTVTAKKTPRRRGVEYNFGRRQTQPTSKLGPEAIA
jgi:hypothetical protein